MQNYYPRGTHTMATRQNSYRAELTSHYRQKFNELQAQLPPYINEYLFTVWNTSQISTVIAYGSDILYFLHYLQDNNSAFKAVGSMSRIPSELLSQINYHDIDEFIGNLTYTRKDRRTGQSLILNAGKSRKSRVMSSLSAMFHYLRLHDYIAKDPTEGAVKIHLKKDKEIDRLTVPQAHELVDVIENNKVGSDRQKKFEEKTRYRDAAICTLLLNTGMRVSECVGIDLSDIDWDEQCVWIIRKGGEPDRVYFNDETAAALSDYIHLERPEYALDSEKESGPLFLSNRKSRMTVRAIQFMLKKFGMATGKTNLSPHKLRKTYGTLLYDETGDIKLVADILGHSSVNTTAKHYIASNNKKYGKDQNVYGDNS